MEVTRLPLGKVKQNTGQIEGLPSNPRQWTQTDIDRIAKSLEETPELFEARPLIVYEQDGEYIILGGNLRYEGAKKNKMKDVPVHILAHDLNIDKLKEIVIKDNGSFGDWDMDALANEWDDLPLKDWGIDVAWDAVMLEETTSQDRKEVEEDDFDAEKDHIEVRCKRGDIWQLGDHRLMCGDSVDLEDVKKLMGGAKADLVFTDPPYGVSYTKKNEYLNSLGTGNRLTKAIENDSKPPQEMYEFWVKAFKNIHEVTKDKMAYYITAPQGGDLLLLLLLAVRDSGFMLKHQLIWNKNNLVLGRCDYNYKHEPIIYGWKIGGTHSFVGGSKFKTSVWDINKPLRNDLHPTMKPVELVVAAIEDNSLESQVVLDLFGGSGTTLIAAEETGRKACLMEYDPHYCDVIIARWEKLTGRKAEKIN